MDLQAIVSFLGDKTSFAALGCRLPSVHLSTGLTLQALKYSGSCFYCLQISGKRNTASVL